MPVEITMPQQSDTMTEGTVVKWRKKEGDKVKSGETIAEIETDKAVMEMEAFESGTLAAIVVGEGTKVPVGGVLGVISTGKEDAAEVKKRYSSGADGASASAGAAKQQAAPPVENQTAAPKAARAAGGSDRPSPPPKHSGAVATLEAASTGEIHEPDEVGHGATREAPTAVPAVPQAGGNGHRIHVSPLAKRIAADKGIDLAQVMGSGPGGRIIQRDVLAFAERPQPAAQAQSAGKTMEATIASRVARGQTEQIPLTKMRAAIATALQKSKQTVPHFYVTIDVDVEDLSSLRVRLNKQLEAEGTKISLNDFVSKAVCAALLKHPAVNAHFGDNQITRFGDVHLGIAVAIPDGLIVPVIRSADQMGLKELQQNTADLAKKARATPPRLKEGEMKGATFTISNLGMYGVKAFDAIINPPSVAILAVAGAEKRPVVKGDQIVARTMMSLTLSVDHRAVDGATAAEFLRTLKGLLEEPGMMLVSMPFTPFHFGPGGAIHVLAPKRISFLAFCVSNVLTDVEPLYFILTRQYPLHRFFHTCLGAALMAGVTALLFVAAKSAARPMRLPNVLKWRDLTVLPVAIGAVIGTFSHVFLDAIMHPDVRPFAPLSDSNPMLGLVSLGMLHIACVLAGFAAVGVVVVRLMAKHP